MIEINDIVKVGNVTGRVLNVHKRTTIGFISSCNPLKETLYDIGLLEVPESQISLVQSVNKYQESEEEEPPNGTD